MKNLRRSKDNKVVSFTVAESTYDLVEEAAKKMGWTKADVCRDIYLRGESMFLERFKEELRNGFY